MGPEALRPALYHRFHFLVPWVSSPGLRAAGRYALRACWLLYFGFVLLVLALRYLILPNIESYRPEIERELSSALGLSVGIGRIEARWAGLNPDLLLFDVRIADGQGQPALAFDRVHSILSWSSLPRLQLRLRLLQIDAPTLHLRRDLAGRIHVAGIVVGEAASDNRLADWVLAQKRIRVKGASVIWEDALRNAPPLHLDDVNLALDNSRHRHRFGLTALPLGQPGAKIDLRGDFRGEDLEDAKTWTGQAFVQIDDADLAVWSNWLDYPVALPNGHGALRAWASLAGGSLHEVTADFALADVKLRLAETLPAIDLAHLSGRLGARFSPGTTSLDGWRIELVARAGERAAPAVRIAPTDFQLDWQNPPGGGTGRGKFSAGTLDLGALAGLAAYLPIDASARQLLDDFAPRGRISELRSSWEGKLESFQSYALKARFDEFSSRSRGDIPGVAGLSGVIDASEQGGSAQLRAQKVSVDLPMLLTESTIALDTLRAETRWKIGQGILEAELSHAEFAGPDAAGSVKGSYRRSGAGPGSVDLSATLARLDARAVWRYLPKVISGAGRRWVRDALKAGTGSEGKLLLKGDLAKFPFLDGKSGQFLATLKAQDVTLDYGVGWPLISGIDGDLRFEGAGMVVQARRGSILGTHLTQTRAEIPDFDAPLRMLKVKGRVDGETAEFLKFIQQSPVAARIDHFTDRMRARGNGRLEIGLTIPLDEARLAESRVDGRFALLGDEVTVDPALPPLQQATGSLEFSEKDLRVTKINAFLFGGPLSITGGIQDGKVLVSANGTLTIDEIRRRLGWPLADNLSGSAAYHARVGIRKGQVELTLDSNLVGVASTLAPPFAKAAGEELPLHFESSVLPAEREQWSATLGNLMHLQLIRRTQGDEQGPERAVISIGRPLGQLPERGWNVGITARSIDLDYWRSALRSGGRSGGTSEGAAASLPLAVDLKADEVILLGKSYHEVSAAVSGAAPAWRGRLAAREAVGGFQWNGSGAGRLAARFEKWRRPETARPSAEADEALKELPALDIVIDDFVVGQRRFGRLEVQAHNEGGVWRLDRIDIANPFGSLSGSGQWQLGQRTQLDFSLDSADAGKLLERLGYGGAVRGGSSTLKGRIGWNGPPADLDYATLAGEMKLEVGKGQFVKLDPGAAGKLLGLISLQGLPRRFSLDFGDVFSDGFAFDSISGKLTVKDGLMRTDRLEIDGPSARVLMRGETDLKRETQRVNVLVQPEVGSGAALGIGVVHPLAGVATLLALKVLQNPLNKVFSFEYLITGKWDDPKVERIPRVVAPSALATP